MSARVIFQLFSAAVSATFSCASACLRVVSDCRYCQIEVAIRPATPMTKLDTKVWYRMMSRPIFDWSSSGPAAGEAVAGEAVAGEAVAGEAVAGEAVLAVAAGAAVVGFAGSGGVLSMRRSNPRSRW